MRKTYNHLGGMGRYFNRVRHCRAIRDKQPRITVGGEELTRQIYTLFWPPTRSLLSYIWIVWKDILVNDITCENCIASSINVYIDEWSLFRVYGRSQPSFRGYFHILGGRRILFWVQLKRAVVNPCKVKQIKGAAQPNYQVFGGGRDGVSWQKHTTFFLAS